MIYTLSGIERMRETFNLITICAPRIPSMIPIAWNLSLNFLSWFTSASASAALKRNCSRILVYMCVPERFISDPWANCVNHDRSLGRSFRFSRRNPRPSSLENFNLFNFQFTWFAAFSLSLFFSLPYTVRLFLKTIRRTRCQFERAFNLRSDSYNLALRPRAAERL